jgi:hypothetical protein
VHRSTLDDLLHAQVLAFNPKHKEPEGALMRELRPLNADIACNREFLIFAASQGQFFPAANLSRRLRRLMVAPRRNETTSRLLKNSGCRLLKKIQRRGKQITKLNAKNLKAEFSFQFS